MSFKLATPLVSEYFLTKTDAMYPNPEDPTKTRIEVRLASTGDVERRADLFNKFKRTFDGFGNFTIEQNVTMDDVRRMEVFLTLAACNIKKPDGQPLFVFKNGKLTDKDAFEKAWALLPPQVSEEIHELILQHNKLWSAEGEAPSNKELENSETTSENISDLETNTESAQEENHQ